MSKPRRKNVTPANRPGASPSPRRRVVVLVSLVGVVTLSSALLRALAPDPLMAQASSSLLAIDDDGLFDSTAVPVTTGRWHSIYIHHSRSTSGSAQTLAQTPAGLADHFVIGNGDGCGDGEIQIGQRWAQQMGPGRSRGADWIRPDCISICVVGDFNQARPTAMQQRQLVQLVSALQTKLHIPRSQVWLYSDVSGAAGIGAHFPAAEFRNQILP